MKISRRALPSIILILLIFFCRSPLSAEQLYSEIWGFSLDLPEGFEYQEGDGENRFSFFSPEGITMDIAAYQPSVYATTEAMALDVKRRLNSAGDVTVFDYHGRGAALLELSITLPRSQSTPGGRFSGWGLCLELDPPSTREDPAETGSAEGKPKLLALVFGPAGNPSLNHLYLSALDSIAPAAEDAYRPGPITEFAWPRGEITQITPFGTTLKANIRAGDAEAAEALVEREHAVLAYYAETPLWKEAWARFYRFIFRDSYERLIDTAQALTSAWAPGERERNANSEVPVRNGEIPRRALAFVQTFSYERNLDGADFVNLVSAAVEGRGDCDSRALLWALLLEHSNIHAAIMVSTEYSHAMGLADINGAGARFDFAGLRWLVAETTAAAALGQINAQTADPAYWIGIAVH
jgi:hypothetical protein